MKIKSILYFCCILLLSAFSFNINAQVIKKIVEVTIPGSLEELLGEDKDNITELLIQGSINGSDVNIIRKMANLTNLDMENVSIVAGGGSYYNGIRWYETQNNEIGPYMLAYLTKLTKVILPESVVKIDEAIFFGSKNLTDITLGNNVKEIGEGIFIGTKPVHLGIPHSVNKIAGRTFENCGSLKTSFLSENMTEIPYRTYYGCTNLTPFASIPEKIEKIGKQAFYNCKALFVFRFPDNVIEIGEESFAGSSFINLTTPPKLESISAGAFKGCESLATIAFNNKLSKIGKEAFAGCTKLQTIDIPTSITEIEAKAFTNCKKVKTINIAPSISEIKENTFSYCEGISTISIPEGVATIGAAAFEGCINLKTVQFSQDVSQIADGAFNYCPLENIYIMNATPPDVGKSNFSNYETSTLYIPLGTLNAYRVSSGWSNFKNIVEMDFTGINTTDIKDIKITTSNGGLTIDSESVVSISIYNISGLIIYSNNSFVGTHQISVPNGNYIIKTNNLSTQIIIK